MHAVAGIEHLDPRPLAPVLHLYSREVADPEVLGPAAAHAALAGAPWRRLAVVGDSIAEGIGEPLPGYRFVPWADRVADALARHQPTLDYLNVGRRGLRTREVRERQLAVVHDFAPDLVLLVCGGNDVLAADFDGRAFEREFDALVTDLQRTGADVVTLTLLDIGRAGVWPREHPANERLAVLAEHVRTVSRRRHTILVDLRPQRVCADRDLYGSDRTHATARGHAVVASHTIRRLGEHLGNLPTH